MITMSKKMHDKHSKYLWSSYEGSDILANNKFGQTRAAVNLTGDMHKPIPTWSMSQSKLYISPVALLIFRNTPTQLHRGCETTAETQPTVFQHMVCRCLWRVRTIWCPLLNLGQAFLERSHAKHSNESIRQWRRVSGTETGATDTHSHLEASSKIMACGPYNIWGVSAAVSYKSIPRRLSYCIRKLLVYQGSLDSLREHIQRLIGQLPANDMTPAPIECSTAYAKVISVTG